MFVQIASSEYQMLKKKFLSLPPNCVDSIQTDVQKCRIKWMGSSIQSNPDIQCTTKENFPQIKSVLFERGPALRYTQLSSVFMISEINPCSQHRKKSIPLSKFYYHRLMMLFKLVINKSLQQSTLEIFIYFSFQSILELSLSCNHWVAQLWKKKDVLLF